MSSNKISVAMCTYNGEKYIAEQLNSILDQSQPVDEIIIGDDGSTDNTVEICQQILTKSNVEYSINVNCSPKGVLRNFQDTIKLCTGDILFFSDQDDVWKNNKVEVVLDKFSDPEVLFVFTNGELVDETLNPMGKSVWDAYQYAGKDLNSLDGYRALLNRSFITGATVALRRQLLIKGADFNADFCLHDRWYALITPFYGKIESVDSCLISYRQHSSNVLGAQKNRIKDKIKRWTLNTKEYSNICVNRVALYNVLINRQSIQNNMYYSEILNVLNYWKMEEKIDTTKAFEGLRCIVALCKSREYWIYGNGLYSLLRDLIRLFSSKIFIQYGIK